MLTGPATSDSIRSAALRMVRLVCVTLTFLRLLLKERLYVLRVRTLIQFGATSRLVVLTTVALLVGLRLTE